MDPAGVGGGEGAVCLVALPRSLPFTFLVLMPPPGAPWREREKGVWREHLSQFLKGLSSRVFYFAFLTAFFRGTLFLIYMFFSLIFNFVAFWQQHLPLLWGLYSPEGGIVTKFHSVQISLNCVS